MGIIRAIATTLVLVIFFYISHQLTRFTNLQWQWQMLIISFLALMFIMVIGTFLYHLKDKATEPSPKKDFLLNVSLTAMAYINFLITLVIIRDVVAFADHFIHFPDLPEIYSTQATATLMGIPLLFLLMGHGVIRFGARRKKVELYFKNLPQEFDGLKIMHITDLHIGASLPSSFVKNLIQKVNQAKPDLIVFTGDILDGIIEKHQADMNQLKQLQAPLGIYYVTGNHEYYWDAPKGIQAFRNIGFHVLINQTAELLRGAGSIQIAGVPDPAAKHFQLENPDLSRLQPQLKSESFKVLLSHAQADESTIPKDMVYVGQGPSVMGLDRVEPATPNRRLSLYDRRMRTPWSAEAFNDEGPAHTVFLDSYLIDKYEVSNKDYGDFVKATGHPAPAYWDDPRLNKPQQPVVGVNWIDAKTYCEYRGKRLPTEAEWEKAARGPHGNLYPWGNDFDSSKANYDRHHDATMQIDGHPEGASYYGVYNMAGNVFEWVADWYDPKYYGRLETMVNPTGPEKPLWLGGTGTYVDRLTVGEKRVIRNEITSEEINELKKQRIIELSKPEQGQTVYIIIGYICAFLGGLLGIFIGWHLLTYKKTLPNGNEIYAYSENERKQGNRILIIGGIFIVVWIFYRILK